MKVDQRFEEHILSLDGAYSPDHSDDLVVRRETELRARVAAFPCRWRPEMLLVGAVRHQADAILIEPKALIRKSRPSRLGVITRSPQNDRNPRYPELGILVRWSVDTNGTPRSRCIACA